jgi:hypothetical protein
MRPVRCDGKRIGWAIVTDGQVTQLDLYEDWNQGLERGEHEVTIELDMTSEINPETGDRSFSWNYLSSKFTI